MLICSRPGVVGEAAVDRRLAVCIDDQQDANVPLLGSGEWTAEENEALFCKRIHEGCVLGHRRLLKDAAGLPGGSRFAGDGEQSHARAIR